MRALRLLTLMALLPMLSAGTNDPGLLLKLDRESFSLTAHDLRNGESGPRLRVVMGSPAHPTPNGDFPLFAVVRNPGWKPGSIARSLGAHPAAPSMYGPLGVARITFGPGGLALHGGAEPVLLGKPISLGCVRTLDEELLTLLDWFDERGGLQRVHAQPDGELHQSFRRPARLVIR